jgi:hypothetical protein
VKEINDDVLTGFSTPACFKSDLAEPGFDKYFTVKNVNGEFEDSYEALLFKKTYILHTFFEVLKKYSGSEASDFFKEMEE